MSASTTAGIAAELLVAAHLMRLGHQVARPLAPNGKYDLVVLDRCGIAERVQVKVGWRKANGAIQFSLRRKTAKYYMNSFETLALVHEDRLWLIPWQHVFGMHTLVMGVRDRWSGYEVTGRSA